MPPSALGAIFKRSELPSEPVVQSRNAGDYLCLRLAHLLIRGGLPRVACRTRNSDTQEQCSW
jgi:hypothetical protein